MLVESVGVCVVPFFAIASLNTKCIISGLNRPQNTMRLQFSNFKRAAQVNLKTRPKRPALVGRLGRLGPLRGHRLPPPPPHVCCRASRRRPGLPDSALARFFLLECWVAAGLRVRRPSGWAVKLGWWPGLQSRAPELCWGPRGQPPAPEQDTLLQQNENRTETQGGLGPHHSQPCVTM